MNPSAAAAPRSAWPDPQPIRVPGVQVLELERQPLILIVNPQADTFGPGTAIQREDLGGHRLIASQRGSLMRWLVDDALARGVDTEIVVEVAHRTSILPLVLAGVGHAVMPSSWAPLAHKSGLRTLLIEPVSHLDVAILSRKDDLTPAAQAFLAVAELHVAAGRSTRQLPAHRPTNRLNLSTGSDLGLGRCLVPGRLLEEDKAV